MSATLVGVAHIVNNTVPGHSLKAYVNDTEMYSFSTSTANAFFSVVILIM